MTDYGKCEVISMTVGAKRLRCSRAAVFDSPKYSPAGEPAGSELTCEEHADHGAVELSPEYLAAKARRAEMRAVLEALGRAWERDPCLRLDWLIGCAREASGVTVSDTDAELLAALDAWKR